MRSGTSAVGFADRMATFFATADRLEFPAQVAVRKTRLVQKLKLCRSNPKPGPGLVLCDRADPDGRAGIYVAGLHGGIFARDRRVKSRALGARKRMRDASMILTTAMLCDPEMMRPGAVGREGLFPPPAPPPLAASGYTAPRDQQVASLHGR